MEDITAREMKVLNTLLYAAAASFPSGNLKIFLGGHSEGKAGDTT
ncbi:hypothetical protein [Planotetraspora phitsanulokensis]|nr:hypothetical protein [Planotetraspora phitsanulokensis]